MFQQQKFISNQLQITNKMIFFEKFIADFQKRVGYERKKPEPILQIEKDLRSQKEKLQQKFVYVRAKKLKRIFAYQENYYKNILLQKKLQGSRVMNFNNIIGINQRVMREADYEQSYFQTIFYLKSVRKITIQNKYLVLDVVDNEQHLTSMYFLIQKSQYIIERFDSFGDARFHQLALVLNQTNTKLKQILNFKKEVALLKASVSSVKPLTAEEEIQKLVQNISSEYFIIKFPSNKLIISVPLTQLLEINLEKLIIETIRYGAPPFEFSNTNFYYEVVMNCIKNMNKSFDFFLHPENMSNGSQTFDLTVQDYFTSTSNKKIYSKIQMSMPKPMVLLFEIFVLNIEEENLQSLGKVKPNQSFVKSFRSQKLEKDTKILRKLIRLPSNMLPENSQKVASFKTIHEKQQLPSDQTIYE